MFNALVCSFAEYVAAVADALSKRGFAAERDMVLRAPNVEFNWFAMFCALIWSLGIEPAATHSGPGDVIPAAVSPRKVL